MPSTSRLFSPLMGLLLLAIFMSVAESQSAGESNTVSPTNVADLAPSATQFVSSAGDENVIQPSYPQSLRNSRTIAGDSLSLFPSASTDTPSASGIALPASELGASPSSTTDFNSESLNSSGTLETMVISPYGGSSEYLPTTVMDIQPSASYNLTATENGSISASLESTMVASDFAPTGSASFDMASSSASQMIVPSPTTDLPMSSSAGVVVPPSDDGSPTGQGGRQEGDEIGGGGGGGMSSGARATVGIFVTLALVGLVALVVVLYRKNYFNPRNIKAMVKGGVRYQTHDDSMSYNDEENDSDNVLLQRINAGKGKPGYGS
ncbi:hypothetical protein EGW08_008581 [Elysia chlorotica]|uniref:Syndecan/Neurexin domain-containing protein n=1 Tax=Elysia chlorotica TaxID=188477 RepID=A0A433TQ31_ELYCH|nr:hypothetical protein EGW08_008581 [Elysia chlorotica]